MTMAATRFNGVSYGDWQVIDGRPTTPQTSGCHEYRVCSFNIAIPEGASDGHIGGEQVECTGSPATARDCGNGTICAIGRDGLTIWQGLRNTLNDNAGAPPQSQNTCSCGCG